MMPFKPPIIHISTRSVLEIIKIEPWPRDAIHQVHVMLKLSFLTWKRFNGPRVPIFPLQGELLIAYVAVLYAFKI